ncbi:MAG: DEAD/DEAH box helicase, partial [Pseudomonadota bacterium]
LFSATFSDEIKKLADAMLRQPVLIEVARRSSVTETVTHRVHPVAHDAKRALLAYLLKSSSVSQVLVFVGTKFGASRLAHYLERQGINATAIHGDKSQQQRTEALEAFKDGRVRVLVATDVAARGLDIDDLPHVINFELPHVPEDYVHRIGRTGRAGKSGDATSLVCAEERGRLAEIEKLIERQIEQVVIPGFEPEPEYYEPVDRGRRAKGHGHQAERERKHHALRPRTAPTRPLPQSSAAKLDFDFTKPYESKVSAETAAKPEQENQRPRRPQRQVAALLGGLPKG